MGAAITYEAQKLQFAEKEWLHYYNRELLKRSIITELQYSVISSLIESRKPSAKSKSSGEP